MKDKQESKDLVTLVKDLSCESVITCQNSRRTLVKMGSTAVPALIEALNNKNQWVRWEATKALSQIADPTATDTLIRLLESKEFDMRWLAAEGLIAIGRKAVVPLLQALIDRPNLTWLQEGAHHVLHDMRRGDIDKVLHPVMVALKSIEASVEVPVAANKALFEIKSMKK